MISDSEYNRHVWYQLNPWRCQLSRIACMTRPGIAHLRWRVEDSLELQVQGARLPTLWPRLARRLHHRVFTTKAMELQSYRLHHWRSLHSASRPRIEQDHGSSSRHERATRLFRASFNVFSESFADRDSTCLHRARDIRCLLCKYDGTKLWSSR